MAEIDQTGVPGLLFVETPHSREITRNKREAKKKRKKKKRNNLHVSAWCEKLPLRRSLK
jgi:hypothetical protein